jgi:trimeric autotransporter adhesin
VIGRGRARLAGAVLAAAGLVGGLAAAAPPALAAGAPGTITTVAGGPGRGPGTNVFQEPTALAAGPDGAVYVGDQGIVRELSTSKAWEGVVAGVLNAADGPLFSGDGGPALKAWLPAFLSGVSGLAVDAAGNVIIASYPEMRVRVVAASTGTFYGQAMTAGHIYTVAGDGTKGYSGDGGPATSAELDEPFGVAVDRSGNLVLTDSLNNRVRVVAAKTGTFYGQAMTAGDIYTVAGDGTAGYSGDGGPATSAELNDPSGVAVDGAGNLIIADYVNYRVRVVAASTGTFYGQAMTAGDIYTVAGDGTQGYSGDGGPATSAELNNPGGVAVDGAGNLVIADGGNDRVRVVAASTGTFYGQAMTAGDIYTIAGDGTKGYSGNGGPAASAELNDPQGVAFDSAGNLVIADTGSDRVRVVAASTGTFYGQAMTAGDIYTVAGDGTHYSSGSGGPAVNAELASAAIPSFVSGVAVDSGNYVVVQSNRAWFICETAGTYFGRAMTAGDIYPVAGNAEIGYSGDGGPALSAKLHYPQGVAVDSAGNLVIADTGNNRVRVVAASTGTFYGQAMTAGDIYTVAGNGSGTYSGDGGPATSAGVDIPTGVAVDPAGNLLIAGSGNGRLRVVAASTGTFYGQAMTAGDIYTVAGNGSGTYSGDGGPATSAGVDAQGVAVDGSGNLVIADTIDGRVRVVAASTGTFYGQAMTAGDIYTVAGGGTSGLGDGGPATSAELSDPEGVAVDGAGNLIIADTLANRVQVVAASTGTFYGEAMTAGDIYTVAGNGTAGYSGDGGPGTSAELGQPDGVAVDGSGNLVIADTQNGLVRLVSG